MEMVLRYQGVRKSDDDPDPWRTTIHPGTVRRVLACFRPHIRMVALFVVVATMEALTVAATPLLLRELVDNGIVKNDRGVVILTACLAVGLAVLGAGLSLVSAYISGRIGQVVSYDLRVQALDHVRRLPLAFFTRTQTGVLVGRLHTELIMAQQQFSGLLMAATSAVMVVVVLAELFYLSWLVGVITLALVPIFIVPWVHVGRVIQRRTQRQMDENAGLGGRLEERFNVQGAMLSKLFGRPDEEMAEYADRANRIRKIGVNLAVWGRMAFVMMTLMASLFRYPTAEEVSLASLEHLRTDREHGKATPDVLRDVSFHVQAGTLTAELPPGAAVPGRRLDRRRGGLVLPGHADGRAHRFRGRRRSARDRLQHPVHRRDAARSVPAAAAAGAARRPTGHAEPRRDVRRRHRPDRLRIPHRPDRDLLGLRRLHRRPGHAP